VGIPGRSSPPDVGHVASINWFTPGYLRTAGIRLVKGRELGTGDGASASVAVVNETFVARFLSGREPIGSLFTLYDLPGSSFAIVGVVTAVPQWGPAERALPEVYLPQLQFARNEQANDGAMLVLKSGLSAGSLEAALRAAAAPSSSQLLVGALRPVDDFLGGH